MLVVHVHVRVRPEDLEAFLEETRHNASASLHEPGVRRGTCSRPGRRHRGAAFLAR